ncbi:hypothetical protein ABZV31_05895 [Streptomyces sp. NPDC005202]|uniref:hypothetical protein n=1 Tax=Streptomyces sp. NPDC005202 TaxID=3157021 RepID=UPI0033B73F55
MSTPGRRGALETYGDGVGPDFGRCFRSCPSPGGCPRPTIQSGGVLLVVRTSGSPSPAGLSAPAPC